MRISGVTICCRRKTVFLAGFLAGMVVIWLWGLMRTARPEHTLLTALYILKGRGSIRAATEVSLALLPMVRQHTVMAECLMECLHEAVQQRYRPEHLLDVFQCHVENMPDDVRAKYDLALLLYERGDAEAAISHCRQIMEIDPGSGWDFRAQELLEKIGSQEQG